uniref:Uncharacterized protein n=1 Tax=Anguilla anguilla TaxID=7936 RepID=A0A0E9VM05_ANGAN
MCMPEFLGEYDFEGIASTLSTFCISSLSNGVE